jgi:hypothetical protein
MQITDTLKAAKELEQAGMSRSEAEALAQQQERTTQEIVANIRLAFAPEFASIRAEFGTIRAEFGTIRAEFGTIRAEFGTIRAEMNSLKTGLQGEFHEALRDQLFKFTVMLFSGLGLTIAALSLIYAMFRN